MKPVKFITRIGIYKNKHVGHELWSRLVMMLRWGVEQELDRSVWHSVDFKLKKELDETSH